MQLLVSVRDAWEADAAVAGGADIVDAKDPAAGALGPVAVSTLRAIRERVPPGMPVSAAIGDAGRIGPVDLTDMAVPGVAFLKLGLGGITDQAASRIRLREATQVAARSAGAPRMVAVAYADSFRSASLPPPAVLEVAAECGAAGFLVDTAVKGRGRLYDFAPLSSLQAWGEAVHRAGLFFAVAGSLGLDDVDAAADIGADVLGVRGAACEAGRGGSVAVQLVARLRAAVELASLRYGEASRPMVSARLSRAS